jgi:hypothetical protein
MSNDTPQPVATKLQARSAAISVHSSNHATTVANAAFAWR